MEKTLSKHAAGFLPHYFRIIGIALVILTFVPIVVIKVMNIDMLHFDKNLYRLITFNFFILGLLFVAWAKDKIEDERTVLIKFKAMAWTFILAVLFVLLKPIMDIVFYKNVADLPSQLLMTTMLIVYLVLYFFQKRSR